MLISEGYSWSVNQDRALIINEYIISTRCVRQSDVLLPLQTERFSVGATPNHSPIVRLTLQCILLSLSTLTTNKIYNCIVTTKMKNYSPALKFPGLICRHYICHVYSNYWSQINHGLGFQRIYAFSHKLIYTKHVKTGHWMSWSLKQKEANHRIPVESRVSRKSRITSSNKKKIQRL